jgi:mycofactocin system glycosyltransferase
VRVALDRTARRLGGGRVLLGGSPLTVFRLGPGGQRVLDTIERGEDVPAGARRLLDRLLDTGAAHPRPVGGRFGPSDVTVIVPVYDQDPRPTLEALGDVGAVVVVDDASHLPMVTGGPYRLLRHATNEGPAAARATGRRVASTALLAFVDADCVPEPGWLDGLLDHFDDERVALVAPRVRSRPGPGTIARYEATRSPLDLGPAEGRVAPATRLAYVPAAALVVRASAFDAVGGFDPVLRVGEDVDLVWRLVEQGWRCRYEPRVVVFHETRGTPAALARQRFRYGRSAAALDRRHPGLVAPAIVQPWAATGWLAIAAGHPIAGLLAGLAPVVAVRRRLPLVLERDREAVRLAALGFVRAGQQLATCVTRAWWPAVFVVAMSSRRARRALLAAAAFPAAIDWIRTLAGPRSSRSNLLAYLALRAVDDLSYGAGVWAGALAERRPGALLPRRSGTLRTRRRRPEPPRPPRPPRPLRLRREVRR